MENRNRSNETDFINFFRGLDEKYQQFLINEMKKKPPDKPKESTKADSARLVGDPESR